MQPATYIQLHILGEIDGSYFFLSQNSHHRELELSSRCQLPLNYNSILGYKVSKRAKRPVHLGLQKK